MTSQKTSIKLWLKHCKPSAKQRYDGLTLFLTKHHKAVASQNLLSLISFLQEEPTRQAREHVIKKLSKLPRAQWNEDDCHATDKVCSTYDIAAILLRNGFVDHKIVADNWGTSIKRCFEILWPYIQEKQMLNEGGPLYWNDFEWLYHKALSSRVIEDALRA
jgi:hypothetical protein